MVRSRYARGAVEVRSWYGPSTVEVRSWCTSGSLPVRYVSLTFQRAILNVSQNKAMQFLHVLSMYTCAQFGPTPPDKTSSETPLAQYLFSLLTT